MSAAIISYNTVDLLRACLRSALAADDGIIDEIVVVDNASSDGSAQMVRTDFLTVRLLENRTNVGFGVAMNQAIEAASGRYVLLLNSDASLHPCAVTRLIERLRGAPRVGLVGPRLLNADGTVQRSAFRFPTPPVLLLEQANLARFVPAGSACPDGTFAVDWVSGACMLGARSLLRELGPFDPRFFMYGEDIDLCYRLRAHGWDIRYVPEAVVTHLGGQSARRHSAMLAVQSVTSMYLFYRKHYGPWRLAAATAVFRAAAAAKLLRDVVRLGTAALVAERDVPVASRRDIRVCRRILALVPPPLPPHADGQAEPTSPAFDVTIRRRFGPASRRPARALPGRGR